MIPKANAAAPASATINPAFCKCVVAVVVVVVVIVFSLRIELLVNFASSTVAVAWPRLRGCPVPYPCGECNVGAFDVCSLPRRILQLSMSPAQRLEALAPLVIPRPAGRKICFSLRVPESLRHHLCDPHVQRIGHG